MALRRSIVMFCAAVMLAGSSLLLGSARAFAVSKPFFNAITNVPGKLTMQIWDNDKRHELLGYVEVKANNDGSWTVKVEDNSCDNIGPYWHAYNPAGGIYRDGTNGCATTTPYTYFYWQVTTSRNWWVEWGGWNSPTLPFPKGEVPCCG